MELRRDLALRLVLEKLMEPGAGRPTGLIAWVLLLSLLLHLVLAVGTHMSYDEAHYALYARHLALSYYDHPPLVGWLQWPAVMLGGSDLLLRVVPMLCWLLTAGLLWRFTWQLGARANSASPRLAAEGALLLLMLSFLPHLLGFALVPDSLLMPLGLALMMQTWRLSQSQQAAMKDWLLLGLLLGLSGLSKYTAVLLLPGVLITLCYAHGGRWLLQPGPWCAALLALVLISPVFIWNAQHEWASFVYQTSHAGGSQPWQIKNFLRYSLAQFLLYGVLPMLACVAGWQIARESARLCLAFALPGLLVTLFLSGRGAALPHWTSWAWVCLLPLAGLGWQALRQERPRLLGALVAAQTLVCLGAVAGLLAATPATPFADLHGWDKAAKRASELAQKQGLQRLSVTNWSLASRVAWYARPMPLVVVQSHHDQYDLWFGRFKQSDDTLWLNWSIMPFDPPVRREGLVAGFTRCDLLERLPTVVLGREVSHFDLLKCSDWQGEN